MIQRIIEGTVRCSFDRFYNPGKVPGGHHPGRTSEAIRKLTSLQAKMAWVIRNGAEVEIPMDEVEVGDIVVVRPGERIPVDGTVRESYSAGFSGRRCFF